jgi:hypothetical protein
VLYKYLVNIFSREIQFGSQTHLYQDKHLAGYLPNGTLQYAMPMSFAKPHGHFY